MSDTVDLVETLATDEREDSVTPEIVIKRNTTITNDPCALCGGRCDPDGIDLMLEGTSELVCELCGWERVPELQHLRHGMLGASPNYVPKDIRAALDRRWSSCSARPRSGRTD